MFGNDFKAGTFLQLCRSWRENANGVPPGSHPQECAAVGKNPGRESLTGAEQRRLIVNADDFGISESVNNGIVQAYREGIVTSTSIMACGQAFAHAVRTAADNGIENIGIHLVLEAETPLSAPSAIPSLVNRQKRLHSRYSLLSRLLIWRKITPSEVERELRAQIARCLEAGVRPTHLDGHGHIHVFPGIAEVVVKLAKEFDINKVRFSFEPLWWFGRRTRLRQYCIKSFVSLASLYTRKLFDENGFSHPDRLLGFCYGGALDGRSLEYLFHKMPAAGTFELMTHPGMENGDRLEQYPSWKPSWVEEYSALTRWKKAEVERRFQVKLISYREM